ncbi:MAG: hypothetical protein OHK0013_33620 [Sandaracinaceae bacterium]
MDTMARRVGGVLVAALLLPACGALTREEAQAALEELEVSAEATALTGSSVEIATSFTIGQAVEAAAMEIRSFVESQLPCAEVVVSGATVTITYGARPGTCTYRDQTYAGSHTITVMRNAMDDVVVSHTWSDFRNQTVEVDGSAMVTWSFDDRTRRIAHSLTWTRMRDGRSGTGTGDRTQGVLGGGLVEGFTEDGERTWTGEEGRWTLDISGVQMRRVDPLPQAGRYVLDTPFGKQLTVTFARTAPRTIRATITSGPRTYEIDVTTLVPG